jgi:hypothetical protein
VQVGPPPAAHYGLSGGGEVLKDALGFTVDALNVLTNGAVNAGQVTEDP